MISNRIKPRERDEIVAALKQRPPIAFRRIAEKFGRHPQTIAAIAKANGEWRHGK